MEDKAVQSDDVGMLLNLSQDFNLSVRPFVSVAFYNIFHCIQLAIYQPV